MNPIEIAGDIINIANTAGLKKDLIDLQAAKLLILTDELALAHKRIAELEADNEQLKIQKPADICPHCQRATGQLQSMKPIPGLELHGLKTGYYKCSNPNCGKNYDKQIKC